MDGVGVRESEHGVQLGARHAARGVEHELGQHVPLGTPAAAIIDMRIIINPLFYIYPLLLRSLTELFLSLNAKQFLTLMP